MAFCITTETTSHTDMWLGDNLSCGCVIFSSPEATDDGGMAVSASAAADCFCIIVGRRWEISLRHHIVCASYYLTRATEQTQKNTRYIKKKAVLNSVFLK